MTAASEHAPATSTQSVAGRAPAQLARPGTHETVLAILGAAPRGRLLDVPAGEGALAAELVRAGFKVSCCDLHPEIFLVEGIEIRRGDLSVRLPYEDASFDCVTCIEGLEHIENPQQAIREFRRLLRPGGHLVVSTPNILNIEERVKWLLFGYTSHFKPLSQEFVARERERSGGREEVLLHVHPISYAELRYTLEKFGFELRAACRDRRKRNLWLYWPLSAMIRLLGRLTPARKRRERWTDGLQSDAVLLGGNTLILHAVKKLS